MSIISLPNIQLGNIVQIDTIMENTTTTADLLEVLRVNYIDADKDIKNHERLHHRG